MTDQILQYRDDVVRCFVDTEFYEDGETIDLISIGACRSDGVEYYAVNRDAKLDRVSDWVREHVLSQLPPYSDPAWKRRATIAAEFSNFLNTSVLIDGKRMSVTNADGGSLPGQIPAVGEIWGYYSDYDWVVICQMYGSMMGLPDHFPRYCLDLKQLSRMLGSPRHPTQAKGLHNALEDARWERDVLFPFLRNYQP